MKKVGLLFHRSGRPPVVSHADVARTPSARAHGLRSRSGLSPCESMLFVWNGLTDDPFTMVGIHFPLDFVFLDRSSRIVDIRHRVPPGTPRVFARRLFQYAIELPAGFCDTHGISVGDWVSTT